MKRVLSRLRAALTPQGLLLLAVFLLLICLAAYGQRGSTLPLEQRLQRTLCHVQGAGHVEVAIRTREASSGSRTGAAFGSAATEAVPCGAVIVAQGADDPLVAMQLRQAVCSFLGLSASAVSVMAGGE